MDKILIIEDNTEVRENLSEILELSGYEVSAAENGKVGVEVALNDVPDLILCDIMMPELDGFGVLRILSKNPKVANIPFIFLTAKAEKEDFRRGMGLGADDYITKPFDDVELLDTIEMRLKKSEKLRSSFDGSTESVNQFFREAKAQSEMLQLTENRESRQYRTRDEIYREGQNARWLFFVSSGRVKTYQTNDYGKEFITHLYGAGEFFGYLPLLQEKPYADSAAAVEDAEIMLIPREDFINLMHSSRDIASNLIKILAGQVVENEHLLLQLAYGSVRDKVAATLATLFHKYKDDDDKAKLSLLREDLASMAGIAKETIIRTLSDFKEEGLIDIVDHEIIIKDVEKLENLPY